MAIAHYIDTVSARTQAEHQLKGVGAEAVYGNLQNSHYENLGSRAKVAPSPPTSANTPVAPNGGWGALAARSNG